VTTVLLVPWIIYLSLPFSLNPLAIFLPCAAMLGITTAITAATFKNILKFDALFFKALDMTGVRT
jgi:hypothetical protein